MASYSYLIYSLSKRDLQQRYRGTWLGIIWLVLQPIILVLIYTFVFSNVLNSRFDYSPANNVVPVAFYIMAGLLVFNYLSDAVIRSASVFIENESLLKHSSISVMILPIVPVLSSIVLEFIFAIIFLFALLLLQQMTLSHLLWALLIYPLLLFLRVILTLSLSFWVSVLSVFIRDVLTALPMLFMLLLLLSPIFYPIEAVPESMQWFYTINPMSHLLFLYRDLFLLGNFDFIYWLGLTALFSLFFLISFYSFSKLIIKIKYIL